MTSEEQKSASGRELASAPQVYAAQGLTRLVSWATANPERTRRSASNSQIIVGLFLIVLGCWIGGDHARLVFFGQHTTGKLVGYREARFGTEAGGSVWNSESMPIIEFTTGHGSVRFQDWMASKFRVPMGGSVPVLYDPTHPTIAMIDHHAWNCFPWAPMFAVALLLLVSGVRGRRRSSAVT